jgi:hypothetical protein
LRLAVLPKGGEREPGESRLVVYSVLGVPGALLGLRRRARAIEQGDGLMAAREKTSARGYGTRHQRLRKAWARQVAAGIVNCARCSYAIEPGEPWDLGHVDGNRGDYQGPEHRACNRATAGSEIRRYSREW